jgi:hypothetical protein
MRTRYRPTYARRGWKRLEGSRYAPERSQLIDTIRLQCNWFPQTTVYYHYRDAKSPFWASRHSGFAQLDQEHRSAVQVAAASHSSPDLLTPRHHQHGSAAAFPLFRAILPPSWANAPSTTR